MVPRLARFFVLVIPVVAAATVPSRAGRAAACCTSATSFGVGRLLVWEDWAVGIRVGHARVVGNWTADGALRRNPPGYSEGVSHGQLWAIARLHERIEVQGQLPVALNDRRADDTRQVAGGLGDAGVALRWQALAIGEIHHVPSLAFIAGAVAPTGRRVEETSPPLFAGTTGTGAWGSSLALESELSPYPWFLRVELGGWLYLSFVRADTGAQQQPGPVVRAAVSAGREVIPTIVLAVALSAEWQGRVHIAGDATPGSDARLVVATASASWRADPHWTLIASLSNSAFPDGFGKNRDARIDGSLGVRYGYF